MSFARTYAEEVLQSRRVRSQRAGFWAKLIGFVLMLTVAAVLRSEPQLRQAIVTAGSDAVMKVSGRSPAPDTAQPFAQAAFDPAVLSALTLPKDGFMEHAQLDLGVIAPAAQPLRPGAATDRVRVNRHGEPGGGGAKFQRAPALLQTSGGGDAPAAPGKMGRLLRDMRAGL